MDPQSFSLILQRQTTPSDTSACTGYAQVALGQPVRVLLIGDDGSADDVDRLFTDLDTEFSLLSDGGAQRCYGPCGLGCWATDTPMVRNVLVVVASDGPPAAALEQTVDTYVTNGFDAIAVLRQGTDPDAVLPQGIRSRLAATWEFDIREVIADVLDNAVLGLDERKVFISYSRRDGAETAERLARVLTEHRFDVFLDRFRIPPGADLLERISDELIDKAMVVVVETPGSVASPWVRYEVSTAVTRRLGVAAVNLVNAPPMQSIDRSARCVVDDDDRLATFVLDQHRRQLTGKRRILLESVWRSLTLHNDPADVQPAAGGFRVRTGSPGEYAIAVHTRPADLHRFRLAHERAAGSRPVVIHPQPERADRRHDLRWLGREVGIADVDEGRIDDAARAIGSGAL